MLYTDDKFSGQWISIQWRHNKRDGVSNHRRFDCLLNCLSRRRSKKHQNSAPVAFVRASHWWPVDSPHKGPVRRKMFPFDDAIMSIYQHTTEGLSHCSAETSTTSHNHYTHDDVIKWKHFPRYWPFVRVIHRSRWIPRTKASDAEFWCFLWSASE